MIKDTYNSNLDVYNLNIVEDLLASSTDWRNIQDIVRLSIRGLYDAVKHQTQSLQDLERHLTTKISKQDLTTSLSTKANIVDLSRTLNDFSIHIDEKVSLDDLQSILQDLLTKSEYHAQQQQFDTVVDDKIAGLWDEVKVPFQSLLNKQEDLKVDVYKRLQSLATTQQLDMSIQKIKLDYASLQEEQKSSKSQLLQSIQSRVSRQELDILLAKRVGETQQIVERCVQEVTQSVPQLQNQLQQLGVQLDHLQRDTHNELSVQEEKAIQMKRDIGLLGETLKVHVEQLRTAVQSKWNAIEGDKLTKLVALKSEQQQSLAEQNRINTSDELQTLQKEIRFTSRHCEEMILERVKKMEIFNDKMNENIMRLRDQQTFDQKNTLEEQYKSNRSSLTNHKKDILAEVDVLTQQLKRELLEHLEGEVRVFEEYRNKLEDTMDSKVDIVEVQSALNSCQVDLTSKIMAIRDEMVGHDLEFFQLLNKKANTTDMNDSLVAKADMNMLTSMMKSNARDALAHTKQLEVLGAELKKKCDVAEFYDFTQRATTLFEDQSADIAAKANKRELLSIMDQKSNHDEVARAFNDLQKDLSRKVNLEELRAVQQDQAVVNETLCCENVVARWTYKQTPLCPGSLVPWNVQVVNTLGENFLWEKDKPCIIVVAQGLYEITLGFYAKKKPKVDVLVNGEIIIGAVNSASYVVHHSSGKLKDTKHSSGCVTGLTMIDFVLLPARARLSVAYQGDLGEGFLGLRKL